MGLVSKPFRFQKKLSVNEFGTQEIVSYRFRETNDEKTFWVQKYFGSEKHVGSKKSFVSEGNFGFETNV